jgi:prepilin-type N-terminal cleavage/methylation domain-containing protein
MRRRAAFTLLELMLATVVLSVLLIGVFAVVSNLGASAAVAAGSKSGKPPLVEPAAIDAWVRVLRDDLSNAAEVELTPANTMTLLGYGALADDDRRRTLQPVKIVHSLQVVDGRTWLVRRQDDLDELTNQNTRRDLICSGLLRFQVVRTRGAEGGATGAQPVVMESDRPIALHPRARRRQQPVVPPPQAAPAAAEPSAAQPGTQAASPSPQGTGFIIVNAPNPVVQYGTNSSLPKAAGASATPAGSSAGQTPAPRRSTTAHIAWRLKVWTADAPQAPIERVLFMQTVSDP